VLIITEKYIALTISLNFSKGASTGLAPAQVRMQNNVARIQKNPFFLGENFDLKEFLFLNGKMEIIRIERIKAITPPSLLGIDQRIAYANKKYHSG